MIPFRYLYVVSREIFLVFSEFCCETSVKKFQYHITAKEEDASRTTITDEKGERSKDMHDFGSCCLFIWCLQLLILVFPTIQGDLYNQSVSTYVGKKVGYSLNSWLHD